MPTGSAGRRERRRRLRELRERAKALAGYLEIAVYTGYPNHQKEWTTLLICRCIVIPLGQCNGLSSPGVGSLSLVVRLKGAASPRLEASARGYTTGN